MQANSIAAPLGHSTVTCSDTAEAVLEHGVFRPVAASPAALTEGHVVCLVVDAPDLTDDVLTLAAQVYAGLTDDEVDAVERIIVTRRLFFGDRRVQTIR